MIGKRMRVSKKRLLECPKSSSSGREGKTWLKMMAARRPNVKYKEKCKKTWFYGHKKHLWGFRVPR